MLRRPPDAIRDQATVVRDTETANQIASIEASTVRAPEGLHDDRRKAVNHYLVNRIARF